MSARLYIVVYDISSPKRWRRVQKAVRRLCQRSQLSVFICRGTPARMARLETELRRSLHAQDDRLMIVDLGPAHSAAAQSRAQNAMSEIIDLGGIAL